MKSRTSNSLKNTIWGIVGLSLVILLQFISKTIFIKLLGAEYNGINGLFLNILQVLNLAELGFAYSVAFSLYKPLNDGDNMTTASIMNFLRRVYIVIAFVVSIAGLLCIPFLQNLIADDISTLPFNLNQLRLYFLLYLINTVSSYLFAYKRTIITADQNSYIVSNVDNFSNIALNIIQILILLITKNYYLFLSLMIIKTLASNIILTLIANKKYPYLNEYKKLKLDKTEKNNINKNVQAMFFHKLGSVAIFNSASIIISSFVSLVDAGIYSNYVLIINAVSTFINIIYNSVTASIGNLCLDDNYDYQYKIFKRLQYLSSFITIFTFVCYLALFNPFIDIWLQDSNMSFAVSIVFVISVNAVLGTLRSAVGTFKNATGLFKKDWYKPILETTFGIAFSILLSLKLGVMGVILGYIISTVLFAIPIENIVLCKYAFHKSSLNVFIIQGLTLALAIGIGIFNSWICSFLPLGFGYFILRTIITFINGSLVFILLTFKTDEFKYYFNFAKTISSKIITSIRSLL